MKDEIFAGNPFNCSKNFEWLALNAKKKYIVDREMLQCSDNIFKNHSVFTVMKTKVVTFCHFTYV